MSVDDRSLPNHPRETALAGNYRMAPITSRAIPALAENFAFVLNVRSLAGAASFTLAPGYELRRANEVEISLIRQTMIDLDPAPGRRYRYLWEQRWPQPAGAIEILPWENWRYFVIAFKNHDITLSRLERSCDVARLELEIGFSIITPDPCILWFPGRVFHVLENAARDDAFFVDVADSDVREIQEIHSYYERRDQGLTNVRSLIDQLGELKALPHSSPLRFLGYFSILESLVTHTPKPEDPYDSITRQVKKKLTLLNERFIHKNDYSRFGGTDAEKIWVKMYAYRSLVAHGGKPDFSKDLQVLVNEQTALKLLKETVKAVVRQALIEPVLLRHLREC